MTVSPAPTPLTSDELDTLATDLARQVRDGRLEESKARMAIYEAVFRTDIIRTETLKWCRRSGIFPHQFDDMVDAAHDFYTKKILDLPTHQSDDDDAPKDSTGRNGKKFFDLAAFADGASAAGSIRQALSNYTLMFRTLYRSVNGINQRGRVIINTDLLQGDLDEDSRMRSLLAELPVEQDHASTNGEDPSHSDRIRLLADMHSEAVNGQRGASRTRIDAGFIREAFRLPELERPLDPQVRHTMLGWLEDEPSLAYRSIIHFYVRDTDPRAPELGQVWANYDDQQLEAITCLSMAHEVAELLVRDALADRARPGKPALTRVRREVKELVAGCGVDAQWAGRMVSIFIDHEHEAASAWDVDRGERRVVRNGEAYLAALSEAASLPGSPLGETPAEVRRILSEMVADARQATGRRRSNQRTILPDVA